MEKRRPPDPDGPRPTHEMSEENERVEDRRPGPGPPTEKVTKEVGLQDTLATDKTGSLRVRRTRVTVVPNGERERDP